MSLTHPIAIVLYILAAFVVLLFIVISMRPDDFKITRSIDVQAEPAKVFDAVNDFHRWESWSPWAKLDSSMTETYSGPEKGPGAGYTWKGNKKVGEGRMTILDAKPNEQIRIKLEFLKPFQATNDVEFTFRPERGSTHVTWTMLGKHNVMSKTMCLFMNMDSMVGKDFEKGLQSLKSVAEA